MTAAIGSNRTSPVFFSAPQPCKALLSNLQKAANTDDSLVVAKAPGSVPTDSKAAYLDLQKRAAESCFRNESLRNFILGSAQKTNTYGKDASAVALMECAVNLHLLETQGVDKQDLSDAKAALEALASKFQGRPTLSIVTMDLKHKARYEAYQKLTGQIDNLLSKNPAGTGEIFESIQLQLAQDYLVDGLRAGVESRWGPLTAQSVSDLMRNADFTPAAGNVLDGQLKMAKAGGNGQTLGEFVRQTLKTLDLHRPGKFEDPVVNDPAASQNPRIVDCLQGCRGHGCGGGQPSITVHGAKAIANSAGIDDRLRASIERMLKEGEQAHVTAPALNTVGTNTEQVVLPQDELRDLDPPSPRNDHSNDTSFEVDLPPPPDDLLLPPDDLPPLNEPEDPEQLMHGDHQVSQVLQRFEAPYGEPYIQVSQVETIDQQQTAPTTLHTEQRNHNDPQRNTNTTQQLVSTEDYAQLNDPTLLTGVNVSRQNTHLPAAFSVDLKRASFKNLERLSGMITLDHTASSDAKVLKALLISGSSSWAEVEKNRTYKALYAQNPTFKSRVDRMAALEKRGAGSADEHSANVQRVELTAGLNSNTYSNRYVS